MCGGCQDVHRLNLEPSLVSIFTDTSVRRLEDAANTHVFNAAAGVTSHTAHVGSYHVIAAGSYLADDLTAVFSVALQNAGLLIIKLSPVGSRGNETNACSLEIATSIDFTLALPAASQHLISQWLMQRD